MTDEKTAEGSSPLPFARHEGRLPTVHITGNGERILIREMTDRHLYLAWRWFFENAYQSLTYMALQREKVRRKCGLPAIVPEVEIEPPPYARQPSLEERVTKLEALVQGTSDKSALMQAKFAANVKAAEETLKCPECGGRMVLRESKYGPFYGCADYPDCRAAHGCHPDGRPLGKPANKETKQARIAAHEAFDKLWKPPEGRMKRKDAYRWMQAALDMTKDEAHIGNFDKEQCAKLIEAVEKYLKENP